MQKFNKIRSIPLALCATVALAMSAPAFAQHGGGGHGGGGGGHGGGGGGHGGGGHGGYGGGHGGYGGGHGGYGGGHGGYGGWHGGYGGWHGGYGGYGGYGGWRGGYGGWRGGYGGWRGGYGGYGGWGPWGWGLGGLGLGLYVATLPYYYSTYWWGGVPYYYADNTYYRWDPGVSQYETVAPPAGSANQSGDAGVAPSELIAYPKNGQTEEQAGQDKFECHRWAAGQTGFDPTQPGGGTASGNRDNYLRAQAACLEGRGYSVK